ncbi:MAG: hypothetical protein R2793_00370 [Flavobacteriaceae bacterium]
MRPIDWYVLLGTLTFIVLYGMHKSRVATKMLPITLREEIKPIGGPLA